MRNHPPYRWDFAPSDQAFHFTALPALDGGLVLAHTIYMIAAQNAYTQQNYKVQHKSEDEEDNLSGRWLCLELKKDNLCSNVNGLWHSILSHFISAYPKVSNVVHDFSYSPNEQYQHI